jgi:hypothetical protein
VDYSGYAFRSCQKVKSEHNAPDEASYPKAADPTPCLMIPDYHTVSYHLQADPMNLPPC